MNYIKKHWKEILIALLVVFSLNKCTVACNRDTKIGKQQIELVQKDSIIKVQTDSLKAFSIRWEENQRGQANYQNLAVGTKEELVNTIGEMKNTIEFMTNKIQTLTNENTQLKKENKQLKEKLNLSTIPFDIDINLVSEFRDKIKESEIKVEGSGAITVSKGQRDKAHKIIEEFMILANEARYEIRPMLGPSGVSIGHIRP